MTTWNLCLEEPWLSSKSLAEMFMTEAFDLKRKEKRYENNNKCSRHLSSWLSGRIMVIIGISVRGKRVWSVSLSGHLCHIHETWPSHPFIMSLWSHCLKDFDDVLFLVTKCKSPLNCHISYSWCRGREIPSWDIICSQLEPQPGYIFISHDMSREREREV